MRDEQRAILEVLAKYEKTRFYVWERPSFVTDDHLVFLDRLRESGRTNMFSSSPFIEEEFGTTHEESVEILIYWMMTFTERHNLQGEE